MQLVETVVSNAKFHSSQDKTSQSTVTNVFQSINQHLEEVKKYIEATIAEIDSHTENMEKLFKMDKWSRDRELYEIIINSYERHRNTLKRIQKMVEGGKVESGLYTLSTKSEIDMVKERIEKLENDLMKKHTEDSG